MIFTLNSILIFIIFCIIMRIEELDEEREKIKSVAMKLKICKKIRILCKISYIVCAINLTIIAFNCITGLK